MPILNTSFIKIHSCFVNPSCYFETEYFEKKERVKCLSWIILNILSYRVVARHILINLRYFLMWNFNVNNSANNLHKGKISLFWWSSKTMLNFMMRNISHSPVDECINKQKCWNYNLEFCIRFWFLIKSAVSW